MSNEQIAPVDASQAKGKSYSFGGAGGQKTGGRYSAAPDRSAAIAAAEAAAAGSTKSIELPPGVTQEAYNAMVAAGLLAPKGAHVPASQPGGLMDHVGRTPKMGPNDEPRDEPAPTEETPAQEAETDADAEGPQGLEDLKAEEAAKDEAAEVDFITSVQEFSQEWFASEGKLSEESRTTLKERHNIDDAGLDFVMQAIGNARAMDAATDLTQMGYKVDEFQEWEKWSAANEDAETREARWEIMRSPNQKVRAQGVKALKDAWAAASSSEPELMRGRQGPRETKTFKQIMAEAQRNPLYNMRGPAGDAYRTAIDERLRHAKRD